MPGALAPTAANPVAAADSRFEAHTFTEPAKPGPALGPAIGDSLAVARANLHFTRAG